jgi:hypothetical protein
VWLHFFVSQGQEWMPKAMPLKGGPNPSSLRSM